MSEGELYKRIKYPHADADDYDSYLKASETSKLLDEAKKDFPISGWVAGIEHDLSEEENHAVYEWFKKWFGE